MLFIYILLPCSQQLGLLFYLKYPGRLKVSAQGSKHLRLSHVKLALLNIEIKSETAYKRSSATCTSDNGFARVKTEVNIVVSNADHLFLIIIMTQSRLKMYLTSLNRDKRPWPICCTELKWIHSALFNPYAVL